MTEVNNTDEKIKEEVQESEELNVDQKTSETLKAEASDEVQDNVEELDTKKVEVDYKEKFYYVAAELDNVQKRNVREREKLLKFGNEKILSSLLDVVDNLDRTVDAVSSDEDEKVKNIVTGINMVKHQFMNVLKDSGLEEIKTIGEVFDPNFHEALTQQTAEGKEDQEILSEFQKGYILNGRLLRAAKVVIVKN